MSLKSVHFGPGTTESVGRSNRYRQQRRHGKRTKMNPTYAASNFYEALKSEGKRTKTLDLYEKDEIFSLFLNKLFSAMNLPEGEIAARLDHFQASVQGVSFIELRLELQQRLMSVPLNAAHLLFGISSSISSSTVSSIRAPDGSKPEVCVLYAVVGAMTEYAKSSSLDAGSFLHKANQILNTNFEAYDETMAVFSTAVAMYHDKHQTETASTPSVIDNMVLTAHHTFLGYTDHPYLSPKDLNDMHDKVFDFKFY